MEKRYSTEWGGLLGAPKPPSVAVTKDLDGTPTLHARVLSEEECAALIAATEAKGYGAIGYSVFVQDYRGNQRLICDDPSLATALWARLNADNFFTPIQFESKAWHPVGLNSRFRFAKYAKGDRFGRHVDGFYEAPDGRRSFFTVNIYLNDAHKDAGTLFHLSDGKRHYVAPSAGDVFIFMQTPIADLLHEGLRVPKGYKYLMRTDVMYAPVPEVATQQCL